MSGPALKGVSIAGIGNLCSLAVKEIQVPTMHCKSLTGTDMSTKGRGMMGFIVITAGEPMLPTPGG